MYLGEDTFRLQPIWEGLFEVYKAIAKVCDKHGLKYYVTDGVALGAVRHKGFIPWDDDFDMSMPRDDYEKFLEIAEKELPSCYKIVTWRNTPEYNLLFAKVQDTRRDKIEHVEALTGRILSNGIYVDILPIDKTHPNKVLRYISGKWFWLLQILLRYHCDSFHNQTKKGKICWLLGMVLSPMFPWLWTHDQILLSCEKTALKNGNRKTNLTCRLCSNVSYRRPPLQSEIWGDGKAIQFGESVVRVPTNVEYYLRNEYGDYLKLPPEDKRCPSHQYSWRCPWWLGPTNTGDLASIVAQA